MPKKKYLLYYYLGPCGPFDETITNISVYDSLESIAVTIRDVVLPGDLFTHELIDQEFLPHDEVMKQLRSAAAAAEEEEEEAEVREGENADIVKDYEDLYELLSKAASAKKNQFAQTLKSFKTVKEYCSKWWGIYGQVDIQFGEVSEMLYEKGGVISESLEDTIDEDDEEAQAFLKLIKGKKFKSSNDEHMRMLEQFVVREI